VPHLPSSRCCSGGYWVDKFEFVNWPYARPLDLAKAANLKQLDGSWRPPVFKRPSWCGNLKPMNEKFTHYANHPCNYLGDPEYGPLNGSSLAAATAAAAATGSQQRQQQSVAQLQQMQRQQQLQQ